MAVTAVTITSGPTVVGRSVTISGTLSRDGSGTNNNLNFLCYNVGYVTLYTITRLSDSATVYNAAGTAGSGVAWTWTGTLPEGNYLDVVVALSEAPYTNLATSANVGLVELRRPLPGIWTPNRDSRGLFTELYPRALNNKDNFGANNYNRRQYHYPTLDGQIYWSAVNNFARVGEYGNLSMRAPTPYGVGIDVPTSWEWPVGAKGGTSTPGGYSTSTITYVSLFYLHNSSKYHDPVAAAKYPAILRGSSTTLANAGGYWSNANGEQAIKFGQSAGFWGEALQNITVSGIGNGLHCLVVVQCNDTRTNGHKVFLDGQLVGSATYTTTYLGADDLKPYYFWGSISKSDLDIGTILFQGAIEKFYASDEQAITISKNPYSYFFQDAPKTSAKRRLFSGVLSLPDPPTEFTSTKAGRLTSQRWSKQPQGKVDINWNHPIAQGLNRSIVITGAGAQNPARPKQLVRYTTRANAFQYSTEGVGLDGNSSDGHQIYLDPDASMVGAAKATYFAYGYTKDRYVYGGVSQQPILSHGSNSIQKTGYAAGQSVSYTLTTSNFEYLGYDAINVVSNYSKFSAAMTFTLGGTQYYYHQGKLVGTNTNTTTATLRYDEGYPLPFRLGGYNGLDSQMGLLWTRALSDAEIAALHENPWQIFKPNPGRLYFLPATTTQFKGGRFLPQRWKSQPQGTLTIDRGNSLSTGLCAAWHPAARQYIGPGLIPSPTPGTYTYQADLSSKIGVKFNGAANSRIALPAGSAGFAADYSGTRLVLFRPDATTLGLVSGTVAGTLGMRLNGGVSQISLVAASNVVIGIGNVPVSTDSTIALCTANSASTETRLHINGQLTFSGTASYAASDAGIWIGAITNHNSSSNFFLALSWDRALTLSQAAAIQENPWQIFKPNPGRMFFLPGMTKRGKFLFLFS